MTKRNKKMLYLTLGTVFIKSSLLHTVSQSETGTSAFIKFICNKTGKT